MELRAALDAVVTMRPGQMLGGASGRRTSGRYRMRASSANAPPSAIMKMAFHAELLGSPLTYMTTAIDATVGPTSPNQPATADAFLDRALRDDERRGDAPLERVLGP